MPVFSHKTDKKSAIRKGKLKTPHGTIPTPFFMPIATRGAIKNITPDEVKTLGADIILSNTYHLSQRPGTEILKKFKGLHNFMGWNGPILTDSGGYQVFSLAKMRKITPEGVRFRSEIDGHEIFLTPESVIDIQLAIGSDIMMILDECPPYPCTYDYASKSLDLTIAWAQRAKIYFDKKTKKMGDKRPLIFGIVQGSTFLDLRKKCVDELEKLNFDGYAIGGVAVGEPPEEKRKIIASIAPLLPASKPRYLMGLGKPEEIVFGVQSGVDMFDCVIPTREARHGQLYIRKNGKKPSSTKTWYETMKIKNEQYKFDKKAPDPHCTCYTCTHYTRAYLRHLFSIEEGLALRLATMHNLGFYLDLMKDLRA